MGAISPDSPETRLRELEQDVSALKARVASAEEDVRSFAPMLASQEGFRATLAHFGNDLAAIQLKLAQLEGEIRKEIEDRKTQAEQDRKEREKGQEERAQRDKNTSTLLRVAAIGLVGTMLTSASTIVAVLVA